MKNIHNYFENISFHEYICFVTFSILAVLVYGILKIKYDIPYDYADVSYALMTDIFVLYISFFSKKYT